MYWMVAEQYRIKESDRWFFKNFFNQNSLVITAEFRMKFINTSEQKFKRKPKTVDRVLGVFALVTIIVAWLVGANQSTAGIEPLLSQALPEASRFEKVDDDTFKAFKSDTTEELIGYVAIGEANGYGGPMEVAVGVDLQGNVIGLERIDSKETPSFLEKVTSGTFIEKLLGKSYTDQFLLGQDIDGITGATYSSRAIAQAVLQASRSVAGSQLGLAIPPTKAAQFKFGIPEITLIALFAVGFLGHKSRFKYTKQARWVTMIVGMVFLGFLYNQPLTLSSINQFLLGYWPEWQTHPYWLLLIGGILFVFTVDNKNPYCQWFCPFGATQECLAAIGGAKHRSVGQFRNFLKWLHRGLAWFAIIVALLFRSPGLSSYEIFGTLFGLTGSTIQFILLGIILIASLFIKRPWCDYLCPIHPIDEFIRMVRGWILETWKTLQNKRKNEISEKS